MGPSTTTHLDFHSDGKKSSSFYFLSASYRLRYSRMKGGCLKLVLTQLFFSFVFFFRVRYFSQYFQKIGRLLIDLPQKNNNITTTAVFICPPNCILSSEKNYLVTYN